jgi:hypothetical protein
MLLSHYEVGMADDIVKLWSLKRSALYGVGVGIIWHVATNASEIGFTYHSFSDLAVTSIKCGALFTALAWVRNKAELAAATSENRQTAPDPARTSEDTDPDEDEDHEEDDDDDYDYDDDEDSVDPLDAGKQEILKAARVLKDGEKQRLAAFHARQDSLQESWALIDQAEKFVRKSGLDIAVTYLFEEMKYWPSWSKREDAATFIPQLGQTGLGGESNGLQDAKISWDLGTLGFTIAFKRHESYFLDNSDDNEYADFSVLVDHEQVFSFMAKRNTFKEFDRWTYCQVEGLKVGPWLSQLIEFYSSLRSFQERKIAESSNKNYIERAGRIDLGDVEQGHN